MEAMESEETGLQFQPRNSRTTNGSNCSTIYGRRKKLIIMVCIITSIVILAIVITSLIPSSDSEFESQISASANIRLPTNVKPLYYKLDLIPYPDPAKNFTIDGKVRIRVICKETSDKITLHIKRIEVNESSVLVIRNPGDRKIEIRAHEYDPDRDFYTVSLGESLEVGSVYSIYIEFTGVLSDELVGFYRSSYVDKATNETRWLGVTQFSPTDARRAFPCMDEPTMKAQFEISLGRSENMTSISNMNLLKTEPIELFVLFDPKYSSDTNKRKIAEVVSHELAHQWFGNLVTPSWWSDLWLKEGFASYVEYIGADHVEPEWRILELFVINELQTVFRLDALNASHQISVPVNDPAQINQIFDDISYKKGCTIIRMMDHFLTHKTFKQGITNYLNKWKYNNTKQDDLWESLTEEAHQDGILDPSLTVQEIMDTWTLQKGYPVIQVDRKYGKNDVVFEQTKFQLGKIDPDEIAGYKWWVPISLASLKQNSDFSETRPRFWISKDTKISSQSLEELGGDDWLIANVQQTGYYRVNYDLRNWQNILDQLERNKTAIHVVNRAQIVDDSLVLSQTSHLPYEFTLNLTNYLKSETEYLPWASYVENLNHLSDRFFNTTSWSDFKLYVTSLIQNSYKRIGFLEKDTDSVLLKAHKGNILKWACKMEMPDCIKNSIQIFKDWMSKPDPNQENPISIDLRGLIYCYAINFGGDDEWNFAWERYLEVNAAAEKDRILTALTCSNSTETLNKYLNWAITPGSGVRKQDSRTVLQNVGYNKIGNSLVFQFLRDNWPQIRKYYGTGISIAGIINNGISKKLNTPSDLAQLEKFKADYEGEFGSGTRAVEEAIEIVKTNILWMDTHFKNVKAWLEGNVR